MENNKLIEFIRFFEKLNIIENDVTSDVEKGNGQKVMIVKYQFGDKTYETNRLYYRDISNLENIKNKEALINYFGDTVYWLDLENHGWPQGSGESDLDNLVINDIAHDGDDEFKLFLKRLANNNQNGAIQKITAEGRSAQYYHNLENNNHWHDLVVLIKEIIKNKGHEVDKKYFSRLVFKWDGSENTPRERSTLSNKVYYSNRSLIETLYKNLKSIQSELQKMETIEILKYKKQIILQGPPGTGKTFTAKNIAFNLVFGNPISSNSRTRKEQLKQLTDSNQFKLIQFHPSYSYEDFVRGITTKVTESGSIEYKTVNKTLAEFARDANKNYTEYSEYRKLIKSKFENYLNYLSSRLENDKAYLNDSKAYIKKIDRTNRTFTFYHDTYTNRPNAGFSISFNEFLLLYKQTINMEEPLGGDDFPNTKFPFIVITEFLIDFRKYLAGSQTSLEFQNIELKNYILIIDEINRANLSSVLGELIYALEYRNEPVESMYDLDGDKNLILPPNLFIIGTMNTADRSVGHIDYAIRRRFAFTDVLPSKEPIKEFALPLFKDVSELFIQNFELIDWNKPKLIRADDYLASDFRPEDVWIGHSYFITEQEGDEGKKELKMKLEFEILPILKEYLKDGILLDKAQEKINELHV